MLKKKGDKDADGASTSRKLEQAGVIEEVDENPCDVLTIQTRKRKYSDAWLFDSGCTYHMCEWFSTFKPFDGDSVLTGNNIVCKTISIDNICMRMLDGYVRTLTNMHHILDLRKNLLSLGPLEAQGCKFSCAYRGIKVSNGSMKILKGE